jgi:hypothetical protein
LAKPELGHIEAALRAADAGGHGYEQHLGYVVTGVCRAGIFHLARANTKPAHPCSPTTERASESITAEPASPYAIPLLPGAFALEHPRFLK